jgi:putative DNA primase/helicase
MITNNGNGATPLEAALSYGRLGIAVFPVQTIRDGRCTCGGTKNCKPGKHPNGNLAPRGVLDATTDIDVITKWWTRVSDANIGIATGKGSSLVVLDVDGPTGEETLAELERKHGPLPPTWNVKTGKGRHFYFRYPKSVAKVKSVARKKLCLDVRADGGYVVGPPSIHQSGHRYTFADKAAGLAECPAWVIGYANGNLKIEGSHGARTKAEGNPVLYSEAEEAKVRSALDCIAADERDVWRDVGAALHSLKWGGKGLTIWTDWSRRAPGKFDDADQQTTWESFNRPYKGPQITTATIFYKARQLGWVDKTSELDFRTDLGNARRLVHRHGNDLRFIAEWGKWIVWNKNEARWEIDDDGAAMRLAKETVEGIYTNALCLANEADRIELRRHALKSQAEPRLKAMVNLAQTEAAVVISASQLDADPWLLGVRNGVINLKTDAFHPTRREDLILKRTDVDFDPEAQCPEWLKFLDTVTAGDADLQSYLQRVAGYILTGSVREEVMFVLHGTGNNGKSTYRETIHSVLGGYALVADASLLIERKTPGGATPEVARLKGRRLVSVNETSENDHLSEARVKFITSSDKITARNLYQEFFDFDPSHKTCLTTNHKPIIRGTDTGIWRRIHLLPFTVAISSDKVEKDFRERRLIPELSGILNWALKGLVAYRQQGLDPPEAVLSSTQDYRKDMDVVGQWIEERCELDPQACVPTGSAYNDYSQWAADEVGWEIKKLTFRRHLSDRGFTAEKGTHGQRMIRGLRPKSFGAIMATDASGVGLDRLHDGRIVRDDGIVTDEENDAINEEENKRRGALNGWARPPYEGAL